ncbi:hypothetical protein [Spirosoma validum]|uniref:Uncharacterized protein n=1 Tax=Spirosoma validum TaxID=2771355 RepID=A0A927GDP7_9BACT|nr:hypothetical protein [Spirosoma validum]MBD2753775.1 hypothetical protein [Spirosoma validum]
MTTSVALDIRLIDRDLAQFNALIDRAKKPISLSIANYNELAVVADEFCEMQQRCVNSLKGVAMRMDKMLDIDPLRLAINIDSHTLADLYRTRDNLQDVLNRCIDFDQQLSRVTGGFWGGFYKLLRSRLILRMRRANTEALIAVQGQVAWYDTFLEILDNAVPSQPLESGFTNISASQLWENRCKAYEYLV